MLSGLTWLYSACGIIVILIATKILQNTILSPLSKIPGPWWSLFTGTPTKIAILTRRQVHYYHALHQKYGPYVRTAPNEMIVSDLASFRDIHRIGTPFVKSDFYKYLNPTEAGRGPYNLFAMVDPVDHSKRRRLLARGFSVSFLRSHWEHVVHDKVALAIGLMKAESAREGDVDVMKWWMFMASDIISQLMFGESFDTLQLGHKTEWFYAQQDGTIANAIAWHFPWVYYALKLAPLPALQRMFSGTQTIFKRGRVAVANSRAASSTRNIFANVLAQADKDDATLTDTDIIIDAAAFNLAGTDTTANTLTYLIWAVLSDASLQKTLEDEVATLEQPLTDSKLEMLPILSAVINETLRLYGAAPGALPRVSPQNGANLGGYFIPGGTTVSTQAWTLHRNPTVFPNPERFDHTRWLYRTGASEEMKAAFSPFGAGSRICIGMHLAYMELRLAAATFFRECRGAILAPSTTSESMEIENIFLIAPKGQECRVVLPTETK